MDYLKISKIPVAQYQVDVSLDTLESFIQRYKNDHGAILNPAFQREHVWSMKQKEDYIKFLMRGGRATALILFNHPGWMDNFKGQMVLVDGKQRLSALLGFLKGVVKIDGYSINEIKNVKVFLRQCRIQIHIGDLPTKKDVINWYISLNSGGTPHTEEEIEKARKLLEE